MLIGSFVALAITAIPYVVGAAMATDERIFGGFVYAVEDGYSYLAKMRQGAEGAWLFHVPYTPEPHPGALVYPFYLLIGKIPDQDECLGTRREPELWKGMRKKLFVFSSEQSLTHCVKQMCEAGHRNMETFSPTKLNEVEKHLGTGKSPVGYWTLAGALAGLVAGFFLTIGTAGIYDIFLGGKAPDSLLPYTLVMFELMILFGGIANFISVMVYTKLFKRGIHPWYDPRFGVDKYGLLVGYEPEEEKAILDIVKHYEPEEEHGPKE
mgnify:CR=1 FL=1